MNKNELEFLWLDNYIMLDFKIYEKIMRFLKDVKELFILTTNENNFIKFLKTNKIYISKELLKKMISNDLKYKAKIKLLELKNKNINIITKNDKEFNYLFKNNVIAYAYGDINILKNNKVAIYNSSNLIHSSKSMLKEFINYIKKMNYKIVSDILDEHTDILCLEYLEPIKKEELLVISYKLKNNTKLKKEQKEEYKIMSNIAACVFFTPTNYNLKTVTLTDTFLENGKDILAVPGNIYDENTYFSNFLIKCGAIVVTSKKDFIDELKYLFNQQKNKLINI